MLQLHKTCRVKGVASSDVYMYDSTRGDADSLATLVRQHYHGHSNGRPSGVCLAHCLPPHGLPDGRPSGVYLAHSCLHTGSRMTALRASISPNTAFTRVTWMTVLRAFCLHIEHYRGISTCSSNSANGFTGHTLLLKKTFRSTPVLFPKIMARTGNIKMT